ncbi:hypothetical protein HDV63DRAFT_387378 [Trichoderma sp. SZMC 28014]
MNALIVGRVITVVGGTPMYLGTLNFFSSQLVSHERRGGYISGISIVWGLGAVLGPAIGGAFSISKTTWRWGFYINLVLGAIAPPDSLFLLPSILPTNEISIKERLLRLDFLGFFLSAGAWTLFAVVFIAAGNLRVAGQTYDCTPGRLRYSNISIYSPTIFLHSKDAYDAIFSWPRILLQISYSSGDKHGMCYPQPLFPVYYIMVFFQLVESGSPLKAALQILPLGLVAVAISFPSGSLLANVKFYKPHYPVSGILITLDSAFFMSILIHPHHQELYMASAS